MIQTEGAPARPPRRRRRRPRRAEPGAAPSPLPLTRATAIRAFAPFASEEEASGWLERAASAEDTADALIGAGLALLNRALHVNAVAGADPRPQALSAERAVAVRIGFGSGEQVAGGDFAEAREIDTRPSGGSRRRRQEDLRPQERLAAVLGGRERLDTCETLLPRARADLDGGREREAALQLRVGLEALLAELSGALADADHERDMATLRERRHEVGEAANLALEGDLGAAEASAVAELLEICERVLRRRRVLRG